ncbi:mitochondrial inner membrane protease subunit 1 isoform X5 [Syngnathoides biaculeatus]|uniref:mitochondrial inner membrane protease subunit 1 isoform X5 n=1 Tax=Syngnathoides biaculeatus TaxID=300417 RepID=UPI002ADE20C0|nr:mitochondrial inner membrane protease subunit 1 isoform X5 [Syngnathoides biaculeatus]
MFRRVLGKTLGFVGYTIQYGCIAHCAFEYIGEIVVCSGPSMEPTIVNKDVVFSERMTRHLCKIQKGDIVIAKSLFDPNMNVCKRVIGLEGDKVYMSGPSNLFKTQTYVPKGHVWLEGDNLGNSTDSRSYGPVPYALIRGRVCLKIEADSVSDRHDYAFGMHTRVRGRGQCFSPREARLSLSHSISSWTYIRGQRECAGIPARRRCQDQKSDWLLYAAGEEDAEGYGRHLYLLLCCQA